jgi:hypothetical protein
MLYTIITYYALVKILLKSFTFANNSCSSLHVFLFVYGTFDITYILYIPSYIYAIHGVFSLITVTLLCSVNSKHVEL